MKFLFTLSIFLLFCFTNVFASSDREVFAHLDKKNWGAAIDAASKSKSNLLLKMAKACKFVSASGGENNFEEIVSFINANPDWPQMLSISIAAENAIKPSTNKAIIVKWFNTHPPKTDIGAKYYALAAQTIVKDKNKLKRIIRDGWAYGDFSKAEQDAFLKKNANLLTVADHAKKIDYIIWHKDIKQINSLLSLVTPHDREMFKAAIAFKNGNSNSETLFRKLPEKEKHHSIVLYSYLKLHEKDEEIDDRLANLIINAPIDHDHAKEWWKLKALFARDRIKHKHYVSAYKIVKNHNAIDAEDVSDAEFLAGWLALRFLNKKEIAKSHFHNMLKVVKQPISIAKATYWLGRASTGKKEAEGWFKESATFNYTFYGQLSGVELGKKTLTLPPKLKVEASHKKSYQQNEFARATNILLKHKRNEQATLYAKSAILQAKSPEEALLIVESLSGLGQPAITIEIAKAASYRKIFISSAAFPTPHRINNNFVESALAYSIIRQETMFNKHAISDKDARGLMQLIPSTACATAKLLNIKCEVDKLITHPEYNIKLGCRELRNRIDKYNGSYLLTFAAYNAGPTPVNRWIENNGDPRKFQNIHKVVDWIELIPYSQTRGYVQRIIENLQIYRAVLGQGSKMMIARDLGIK